MNAAQRLRDAQALASQLHRSTGYATTPTVDGRVALYAPLKHADQALASVRHELRLHPWTARLAPVSDPRLAVVEVNHA